MTGKEFFAVLKQCKIKGKDNLSKTKVKRLDQDTKSKVCRFLLRYKMPIMVEFLPDNDSELNQLFNGYAYWLRVESNGYTFLASQEVATMKLTFQVESKTPRTLRGMGNRRRVTR